MRGKKIKSRIYHKKHTNSIVLEYLFQGPEKEYASY